MSLFDLNFPFFNNRVQITLHQFLTNPTGKTSSFFARREFIKNDLEQRYFKLINKYGKFDYKIYKDLDSYYFHFKIPSETFDKFFYDVVLQFVPDEEKFKYFKTIGEYSMNFFSNSPHMMFTYTYVLHQGKITIEPLIIAGKYAKRALNDKPKVTNPIEIFGFEKSCYFAALWLDKHKLLNKEDIEKQLQPSNVMSIRKFFEAVDSQEKKFMQYTQKKKEAKAAQGKKIRKRRNKQEIAHDNLVKNFNLRELKDATKLHKVEKLLPTKPLKSMVRKSFKSVFSPK